MNRRLPPTKCRRRRAFGQYCVVMPDQDAVIAITSGVRDMQAVLNLIWNRFLPACGPEKLRSDPEVQAALRETLEHLAVPVAPGEATAAVAAAVMNRRFVFPPNDQKLGSIALHSGVSLVLCSGIPALILALWVCQCRF